MTTSAYNTTGSDVCWGLAGVVTGVMGCCLTMVGIPGCLGAVYVKESLFSGFISSPNNENNLDFLKK